MKRFILLVVSLVIAVGVAAVAYPMVSPYHAKLRAEFPDPAKRKAAVNQAIDFEKTHYRALMGDKAAQYKFGLALLSGDLGFKDSSLAVSWFKRSADQGYAPAEFAMAHACLSGDGIAHDDADGAAWAGKAMQDGSGSAARELVGLLLAGAIGEKQDMDQGLSLLKTAQSSESLQIASTMDARFKAIYALPREQRDAELQKMGSEIQADVRARFPGIEKGIAKRVLVAPEPTETAAK